MPDALPSCFRGGAPPEATAAGPILTTSIYDTPLGLAALSWTRTLLGLSLRVDIRLHDSDEPLTVRVRPWLLWRRRGRRRLPLPGQHPRHLILSWDLSRARFPPSGGPEPSSSFSLSLSLDSHPLLRVGDLHRASPLISRREHTLLGDAKPYTTTARFAGKDHEISISIGSKEKGMSLELDGQRVLHVRRIRWKFRGSERVDLGDGNRIRVSWDLHRWFFESGSEPDEAGRAVFLIRFEREGRGSDKEEEEGYSGKGVAGVFQDKEGYSGKSLNWSDSSSVGGAENGKSSRNNKKKMKSFLTTSSSSSSSSASSASGSSAVLDWASVEEAQLTSVQGFSLLVYARKD
ncbi:hypothetical protein J5N97_003196 [Dioscorea zingiberensis]|uniref:DUF868 family protein n=1 Tax=Dioscorea zingiberensis TaxID=325984 RepID=A0A9D5HPU9_9LILI|nr:hypothetical protein J5N97_003196 [Dioscorea zingiberensis]